MLAATLHQPAALHHCGAPIWGAGLRGGASSLRSGHTIWRFSPSGNVAVGYNQRTMSIPPFRASDALTALSELADRVSEFIDKSPAGDVERNAREHLAAQLAKCGLVTQQEHAALAALLQQTQTALGKLEARLAALEASQDEGQPRA